MPLHLTMDTKLWYILINDFLKDCFRPRCIDIHCFWKWLGEVCHDAQSSPLSVGFGESGVVCSKKFTERENYLFQEWGRVQMNREVWKLNPNWCHGGILLWVLRWLGWKHTSIVIKKFRLQQNSVILLLYHNIICLTFLKTSTPSIF